MEALNFKNHFNEKIAEKIVIKGNYIYRRDLLRIARMEIPENFSEEKTFLYDEKKEILRYHKGKVYAGDQKDKVSELKEIDNSKFIFWKLFNLETKFSIMVSMKHLFTMFNIQSRVFRSKNENFFKATFKIDFINNKIEISDEKEEEIREKGLRIESKNGEIEKREYKMPYAIIEEYIRDTIGIANKVRFDFMQDGKGNDVIRLVNEKKMEILFATLK